MWIFCALLSATFLGFYDVFKKKSLTGNAVLPVLFLNTLFCALIFLPFIALSYAGCLHEGSLFYVAPFLWQQQRYLLLKAVIVLSSWICGYYGIKHLPLTIVGPIHATRPILVLLGALLLFGETLNLWQWTGIIIGILSFFLLSKSGKREGINFRNDKWIALVILASVLGAVSALYDKHLLAPAESGGIGIPSMVVQSYNNIYQCLFMGLMLWISTSSSSFSSSSSSSFSSSSSSSSSSFSWRPTILFISIALSIADFAYYYALSVPGAMVCIVSMIRRSSVLVSFAFGALVFHERNLKYKTIDLCFVFISLLFLCLGSVL